MAAHNDFLAIRFGQITKQEGFLGRHIAGGFASQLSSEPQSGMHPPVSRAMRGIQGSGQRKPYTTQTQIFVNGEIDNGQVRTCVQPGHFAVETLGKTQQFTKTEQ